MIVAVFGKGRNCPKEVAELAYWIGGEIAGAGHVLLSGALAGVMFDAADGAAGRGGQVIGLAPVEGSVDARFPGIVLRTGLTAHVRNVVLANACDAAVMLHGSHGAMQELAVVLDREIPVVAVETDRWAAMGVPRLAGSAFPGWLRGLDSAK